MAKSPARTVTPLPYERPSPAVAAFIAGMDPVRKPELTAVRELILAACASIQEGIKWNAPSFWNGEWFATFNLRAKTGLTVVLHRGAKVKAVEAAPFVEDPDGLLQWITKDRAVLVFANTSDIALKAGAVKELIRRWSEKVAAETGG